MEGAGYSGRVVHTKTFMPHFSDSMFHVYPEFPAEPSFPSNHLNLPAAFFGLAAFRWMVHIIPRIQAAKTKASHTVASKRAIKSRQRLNIPVLAIFLCLGSEPFQVAAHILVSG